MHRIEKEIVIERAFIDDCIVEIGMFQKVGDFEKAAQRGTDMQKSIKRCQQLQQQLFKLKERKRFFKAIEDLQKRGIKLERVHVDREKILAEVLSY